MNEADSDHDPFAFGKFSQSVDNRKAVHEKIVEEVENKYMSQDRIEEAIHNLDEASSLLIKFSESAPATEPPSN